MWVVKAGRTLVTVSYEVDLPGFEPTEDEAEADNKAWDYLDELFSDLPDGVRSYEIERVDYAPEEVD